MFVCVFYVLFARLVHVHNTLREGFIGVGDTAKVCVFVCMFYVFYAMLVHVHNTLREGVNGVGDTREDEEPPPQRS